MSVIHSGHYPDFFEALWGQRPFAWQTALAERVLQEGDSPWPEVIALPTASGKTACIDIAIFALAVAALNTPKSQPLSLPRRIFFVVDRRVIVDEAFDRARRLARRLQKAEEGVLKTVADALRQLGGTDEPLACFLLRGGMYRSDAWAHSPVQPTVIASTVDQLGSRLLFRAYGRSHKAWPIQAGLAGNDALIFLDEAHCARPFLQTLQAVSRYRDWAEKPLAASFQTVVMSATPPPGLNDIFRDDSAEGRTPGHPLGDRQLALKPTVLEVAARARGGKAIEEFALALIRQAERLVDARPVACVIFVNRVATGREVYRRLAAQGCDAVLLTGRMRPFDKDDIAVKRLKPLSSDQSSVRELSRPMFVVATQTLEVGANLDFDVLVTECASLDALRQRFGRLNRMGREITGRDIDGRPMGACGAVLIRADQTNPSEDDPVYGAALAESWKWLNDQSTGGVIDFGIAALEPKLPEGAALATLNAPTLDAPVMLPAHVDCWAQTAPEPMPTPEPALFLHGPGNPSADVMACWRADIDLDTTLASADETSEAEKSLDVLTLCPPATAECVAVPIRHMRQWLAGVTAADQGGDVEGSDADAPILKPQAEPRRVIRWRSRDEAAIIECRLASGNPEWGEIGRNEVWTPITERAALRPGDVLVIPAGPDAWQGLADLVSADGGQPILDFGDRAYAAIRARALLRLHPGVMAGWGSSAALARLRTLASEAEDRWDSAPDDFLDDLQSALAELGRDEGSPAWICHIARGLTGERPFKRCVQPHPRGGLLLRGTWFLAGLTAAGDPDEPDLFSDEDDASSSSGTRAVPLHRHLEGVADFARRFAECARLPPDLIEVLTRAGLLHDLGKADPRFQSLLRGGRPAPRGELLAKSIEMPQGRLAHEVARKSAGYPKGARHELLSVTLAESHPTLLSDDTDLRDLVLHLVASHHGHCRPFAPVAFDDDPVRVSWNPEKLGEFANPSVEASSNHGLERLDSGVPERFWRLTRRYGWWGLVWLEAILRLADHRRSEAEAQGKTDVEDSHE
jgi:CRISPR-associated endonuclease/helicase Cas3